MKIEFEPTGLVRQIDDLGRVVIPKDFRIRADIHTGDSFEIFADGKGNFYIKFYKRLESEVDEE